MGIVYICIYSLYSLAFVPFVEQQQQHHHHHHHMSIGVLFAWFTLGRWGWFWAGRLIILYKWN
jgi:hypothetical protein